MTYKEQLRALQESLLAEVPDARVVATLGSALVVHGFKASAYPMRLDVSGSLFQHLIKKYDCSIIQNSGDKILLFNGAYITEGTFSDIVSVDAIKVYSLDGLRTRYEAQSRVGKLGSIAAGYIAADIAAFQAEQAKPKPESVVTEVKGPTWGELDAEELAFEVECKSADWYYSYSDDLSVYRCGKAQCEQLEAVARNKGGNYALIYKHYSSK